MECLYFGDEGWLDILKAIKLESINGMMQAANLRLFHRINQAITMKAQEQLDQRLRISLCKLIAYICLVCLAASDGNSSL